MGSSVISVISVFFSAFLCRVRSRVTHGAMICDLSEAEHLTVGAQEVKRSTDQEPREPKEPREPCRKHCEKARDDGSDSSSKIRFEKMRAADPQILPSKQSQRINEGLIGLLLHVTMRSPRPCHFSCLLEAQQVPGMIRARSKGNLKRFEASSL